MTEKITPQTFNDAAWNMGITIRWNDSNQNGTVESSEVTCYGNASDFYNDETADKIIANEYMSRPKKRQALRYYSK